MGITVSMVSAVNQRCLVMLVFHAGINKPVVVHYLNPIDIIMRSLGKLGRFRCMACRFGLLYSATIQMSIGKAKVGYGFYGAQHLSPYLKRKG